MNLKSWVAFDQWTLLATLLCPMIGALMLLFTPSWKFDLLRKITLKICCSTLLLSLLLWLKFDFGEARPQFAFAIFSQNIDIAIAVDGISLLLMVLTAFTVPFCMLVAWKSVTTYVKEYCIAFLFMETLMLFVFCTLDLLVFYGAARWRTRFAKNQEARQAAQLRANEVWML